MKCQECGAENAPGTKFCTSCGASLSAAAPAGSSGLQPLDTQVDHAQREYSGTQGRISYRIDGTTLQVGDIVDVEIQRIEVERGRIALGWVKGK